MPPRDDGRCAECRAALAHDQRYCLACGARRAPLPAAIAALIAPPEPPPVTEERPAGLVMPSPRAAAVAVLGLLGFGVIVGGSVAPSAESQPAAAPVVVAYEPPPPAPAPAPAATTTPAPAPAPAPSAPASTAAPAPAAAPAAPSAPVTTTPPAATTTPAPAPTTSTTPDIKHVFLIVLSGHGYNDAFGPSSTAPYLAKTLTAQGELLSNYYGVTQGELANEIALVSGQGPTNQTAANCPTYNDVAPGTVGANGQASGDGCVYPVKAQTLADQLVADGRTWKAYVEDVGNGPPAEAKTCRHPAPGAPDGEQAPRPGDAYVTWRNPFVYFHSLVDGAGCAQNDVGLDQLTGDLSTEKTTPTVSMIVSNRCHDGSDQPCDTGQPAGLPAADAFLRSVVPEIENSAAYKAGGMIAITFDQAPQAPPNADSSSCCDAQLFPNIPPPQPPADPTTSPGGGKVGLLLISQAVKPGSSDVVDSYNHFSLLRSIEDLFSLDHLGYAADPALPAFDKAVYNAKTPSG